MTPASQPDEEHKQIVRDTTEARQGHTGDKVRYVLIFGLAGVIVAFGIVFLVYSF